MQSPQSAAARKQHGMVPPLADAKTYTGSRIAQHHASTTPLASAIDRFSPDLVVLAGFMRVLTDAFVAKYAGRMLNVHPSLLPSFPGLRTHQQALDAGVRVHGASVHFVTPTLDHGPIVAQGAVPVVAGDDAAALAARVLTVEHIIYPRAVRWFIEGRLFTEGERVALTPSEPQWLFADIAGEGV